MNIWPFNRLEKRSDNSAYTQALVDAIAARADGETAPLATSTAALEACAGFVSRAFMAAEVKGDSMVAAVLTPECMGMIGRALIRSGEIVFLIDTSSGTLRLIPAKSHEVDGDSDPNTWTYRLVISGPVSSNEYESVDSASVVHIRYAVDPESIWKGIGPIMSAKLAGNLSAETAQSLGYESSMPIGAFLELPVDGEDSTIAKMKADIRKSKGSILTVESGDWDNAGSARADYEQKRFGPNPPAALVETQTTATKEIYAACGLNPALFVDSQGSGAREAYRQALFGVVAPLGKLVESELTAKLEREVRLDWMELRAADIASRARAFKSMLESGMPMEQAAALSGLMVED